LCGTWKKGQDNWANFTCPDDTRASYIRIIQPNEKALTVCGAEIFGYKLDAQVKSDDLKEI
jgi:hypothetical protein